MNVLSLFDGLSGLQLALKNNGVKFNYFASEIDDYAVKITQKHFPKTIQLGDVENWQSWNLPKIDLLSAGFPCQDLSIANSNGKGLDGKRSGLFWTAIEILNTLKPKYFLFENVESMKTKDLVTISNTVGVQPIMIDSALVSAQRRKRYFWANFPITRLALKPSILYPNNKIGLVIADILEKDVIRQEVKIDKSRLIQTSYGVRWNNNPYRIVTFHDSQQNRAFFFGGKFGAIPAARTVSKNNVVFDDLRIERLTWTELERLMGLPDGYTDLGEDNRVEPRGKAIDNGFQIDVVNHIISDLLKCEQPIERQNLVKAEQLYFAFEI